MKFDINILKKNSPETLDKIRDLITSYLSALKDATHVQVEICNTRGCEVLEDIRKEFPEYHSYWEGEPGYTGVIYVDVPAEDWNDELKAELAKFDSWVGLRVEKKEVVVPKKGIEYPYDLQQEIDHRLMMMVPEARSKGVKWNLSEVDRNWILKKYLNEGLLEKTEIIIKEYDTELTVHDWTQHAGRQLKDLEDYSIEMNA